MDSGLHDNYFMQSNFGQERTVVTLMDEILVNASDDAILFKSRATLSTLVIFETFAVGIFSLFLYAAVVHHTGWGGAILAGALCVAIFIWWQSFSIEIDDAELRYRSLFSRRTISLQHISKALRKIELASQGIHPPNRIEIYGTVDGKDVKFDINVKPFPLADVKQMQQLLNVV
jgi:hypothetical protein